MSERVVEVNLKFVLKDTNSFPPVSGLCVISAKAEGGQEVKSSLKYDGNTDLDIVKTIPRMEGFTGKVMAATEHALPKTVEEKPEELSPEDQYNKEREAHYAKITADLNGKKIGEIRHFITKHGIPVKGTSKPKLIADVIQYMREAEALQKD